MTPRIFKPLLTCLTLLLLQQPLLASAQDAITSSETEPSIEKNEKPVIEGSESAKENAPPLDETATPSAPSATTGDPPQPDSVGANASPPVQTEPEQAPTEPSSNLDQSVSGSPEPTPLPAPSTGTGVIVPSEGTPIAPDTASKERELKISIDGYIKQKKFKFGKVTVAPQLGYLFYQKSALTVAGFRASVEPRHGFLAKLQLGLGGDKFAVEIAPIFALEFGGINTDTLSGVTVEDAALGASFLAVGSQLSFIYRFPVKKFFPHVGGGIHSTYLFGDEIVYGTEIYGRIPIGFTAFFSKHVAFVFDIGLMYGATGVQTPPALPDALETMDPELKEGLEQAVSPADVQQWYYDNQTEVDAWFADNQDELPENYNRDQLAQDYATEQVGKTILFGAGFGLDVTIGIRFP